MMGLWARMAASLQLVSRGVTSPQSPARWRSSRSRTLTPASFRAARASSVTTVRPGWKRLGVDIIRLLVERDAPLGFPFILHDPLPDQPAHHGEVVAAPVRDMRRVPALPHAAQGFLHPLIHNGG